MKSSSLNSLLMVLAVVILVVEIVLAIAVFNLTSYVLANHGNTTGPSHNVGYITISASGSASAQPTTGTMYLSVQGMGKSAAAATANLSVELTRMNSSISRYINGNTSLIQTTSYQVYNQTGYYYNGGGVVQPAYPYPSQQTYNGFIATEQLTVTFPNVKNLSPAISSLSMINNTQVTGAYATLSDAQITALRSAAFSSALKNATSQASILTGNAALTTQNISVNAYNFYPLPYALGATGSAQGINSSTAVNPSFYSGTASVTESVTIVFSYNK